MIVKPLASKPLPACGDGQQIRDWLYVKDHCSAIRRVLEASAPNEIYNVGGWNEKPNIDIVHTVRSLLDELSPRQSGGHYKTQITCVTDRLGHDRRYAIDTTKIRNELGWRPVESFKTGIRKTVEWYLANPESVSHVQSGAYKDWTMQRHDSDAKGHLLKILLLGANGQAGWELRRSLAPLGELFALHRQSTELCGDLSNFSGIAATVLWVGPDVIVNAAAHTAVDRAESEPELARTMNGQAPGVLAEEAAAIGALLVH